MKRIGGFLVACAVVGMIVSGCAKSKSSTSGAAAPPASATTGPITDLASTGMKSSGSATPAPAKAGDAVKGKAIFLTNCAGCHGANAQGGVGPNLHGTLSDPKMARTDAALIKWIKDPLAPMPKLYPSPLNEQDVADVAAYVKTL
ncbi:MAG: c-type cytochrome [Vulcanimicrobiaceae bacterium]